MDESFSVAGSKFPDGEPADDWTVEEVVRWSLDQYHNKAIDQTSQKVESFRDQCEKECEDVMTLHSLAVEMASKGTTTEGGGGSSSSGVGEENVNPQSENNNNASKGDGKIAAKSTATSFAAGTKPAISTIEVQMTVGPHAPTKYLLRPRPGQPCLLGRSKGKKFIKNGVSLHKDQEVSTTHGKFVVEGGGLGLTPGGGGETAPRFYFIDVGSTNGSVYNGDQLEPNEKLLLEDGMEFKVGNSMLRVALG